MYYTVEILHLQLNILAMANVFTVRMTEHIQKFSHFHDRFLLSFPCRLCQNTDLSRLCNDYAFHDYHDLIRLIIIRYIRCWSFCRVPQVPTFFYYIKKYYIFDISLQKNIIEHREWFHNGQMFNEFCIEMFF